MKGHGTIHLDLSRTNETCRVDVRDSGPDMPAEVLEQIFTPFFTTKARGSELGLPTARRLVEAHRGNIAVTCPPGGGTVVTATLPLPSAIG